MFRSASRRLRRSFAPVVAAAGTLALAGCGVDVGGIISNQVNELDIGIDMNLSNGPSCLPEWVTHPAEDAGNQGWSSADLDVCVSAWPEIADSVDIDQQLPAIADDADLAAMLDLLIPLMLSQIPGGSGFPIGGDLADLSKNLEEQGVSLSVYGDQGHAEKALLVLTATGDSEPGMMTLVMGVYCQGSC